MVLRKALGFQLVIHQRKPVAFIGCTNVVDVAAVHAQHAQPTQLTRRNEFHCQSFLR